MIDSLVRMQARVACSDIHERLGLPQTGYFLVTLHRPALVDGPLLTEVLIELDALSRTCPVVFPMHPRTRTRASAFSASGPELHLIDAVGYVDFLALECHARAVITDSGGVQEETTFLGVPCFTLRDNTERPVTISQGTNRLLGLRLGALRDVPWMLASAAPPMSPPPGWDGRAGERVAEVIADCAWHGQNSESGVVAVGV